MGGWNWDVPKEARLNPDIKYGTMTDTRDNKVYKTVKIGDQIWMAENLNYADSVKTPSLLKRSKCYDNKAENCTVAGRLYNWVAAIDSVALATDVDNPQNCGSEKTCTLPAKIQGICPPGWHLPTYTEWNTLFTEVGGESPAGEDLKSQTGWYSNDNGTDAYGFSALPTGVWYGTDSGFSGDSSDAYFCCATEYASYGAYIIGLRYAIDNAYFHDGYKDYGCSVRCIQN